MDERLDAARLREIIRHLEQLGASPDRTVLLYRRGVDPETGCEALHWWAEPAATGKSE